MFGKSHGSKFSRTIPWAKQNMDFVIFSTFIVQKITISQIHLHKNRNQGITSYPKVLLLPQWVEYTNLFMCLGTRVDIWLKILQVFTYVNRKTFNLTHNFTSCFLTSISNQQLLQDLWVCVEILMFRIVKTMIEIRHYNIKPPFNRRY